MEAKARITAQTTTRTETLESHFRFEPGSIHYLIESIENYADGIFNLTQQLTEKSSQQRTQTLRQVEAA